MDEILLLNRLTGRVHRYDGVMPWGPIVCDCDRLEAAYEADEIVVIDRPDLEVSIWEEAPCLSEDWDGEFRTLGRPEVVNDV